MPNGFWCEQCGRAFVESHLHTKITIDIEPREYAAVVTLCSVACLEAYMPRLRDEEAWSSEHRHQGGWLRLQVAEIDTRSDDVRWLGDQ